MGLPRPPLLVITDRHTARRPLPDVISAAIEGGCRWIMLREKDISTAERLSLVGDLLDLAGPSGATISVNGDLAAASATGAAHLPAGHSVAGARGALGPQALVGASCHSMEEALAAAAVGADYVTLSPVFATASKPGYGPALGLDGLAEAAHALPVPVIALGGVEASNAAECLAAGAAGLAVMGAVMRAGNPAAATAALIAAMETANP